LSPLNVKGNYPTGNDHQTAGAMIYFWFFFGAAVGSFLNVCIHRLPRGESIVFPGSHCPNCGKGLSPLDLIPVLGFFLLAGRCRYCRSKISFRYPLVEALTAFSFSFIWFYASGNLLNFIFYAAFIALLLLLSFTDLETQVIPDAVSIGGIVLGLTYHFLNGVIFSQKGFSPLLSAFLGAAAGYALLYTIGKAGSLFFKKEVMGEGDFYVAAFLGAALGLKGLLLALFLGYLLAAIFSLALLLAGKIKIGQYIPFGPALALGGVIALFWEQSILSWYWSWFI
jgi:leader peptidase (prepilin peptidase)/N-methyltransferase